MGVGGQCHLPADLALGKGLGTHCTKSEDGHETLKKQNKSLERVRTISSCSYIQN
jgi:hypothetical protein